ncbi:MAG: DUF2271 domain-containing protein [Burkholderiaceae bacterium]
MFIRHSLAVATAAAVAGPAAAGELLLKIDLPRMSVAEYHRPYVAAWIEKAGDQSFAGNLAVWYDIKKRDDGGRKWLKEMRQWWRKGGRELSAPDGVTGATRPAGEHALNLLESRSVAGLAPGRYEVVVEAARENGGREVLRVPFDWPVAKPQAAAAHGDGELAALTLEARP